VNSEENFARELLPMQPDHPRGNSADIVVVGAGLAGVTASATLARQGWRVILVDPRPSYPPVFKAEKIEPEQAAFLTQFGLHEGLRKATHIAEIRAFFNGRYLGSTPTNQYGIYYNLLVNTLRTHLPETVEFKLGRIVTIANSGNFQVVTMSEGARLTCRLVVLACGLNGDLAANLGVQRIWVQKHQSVALGFTLVTPSGGRFPFDAVTYRVMSLKTGIDYVSLFPIGDTLRANLFAFPRPDAEWVRRFINDPGRELPRVLPKLQQAIGEYRLKGKVESSLIHLYRTQGEQPPGVVLIGDACQNVCPSTGIGLTKIFTDVQVLRDCVPRWFATAGMRGEKLREFLLDPRKQASDAKALGTASYRRYACTIRSPRWKIHRVRLRVDMELNKLKNAKNGPARGSAELQAY
jgi:2-polyprenyl-6-methoxyphenol hydroxylase-like FAD-dependent oxidoreductase